MNSYDEILHSMRRNRIPGRPEGFGGVSPFSGQADQLYLRRRQEMAADDATRHQHWQAFHPRAAAQTRAINQMPGVYNYGTGPTQYSPEGLAEQWRLFNEYLKIGGLGGLGGVDAKPEQDATDIVQSDQ